MPLKAITGKQGFCVRPYFPLRLNVIGQGIAVDFLFAVLVFLLVLNAALGIMDSGTRTVSDKALLGELEEKTTQTLDALVRTYGIPNDWETLDIADIEAIGLAKRDRALDIDKVSKFAEWGQAYASDDYNKLKSLLLIGYDYYFSISDSDGTVLYSAPDQGDIPTKWDAMTAVNVKRVVNLEGSEALAELTIYYPR